MSEQDHNIQILFFQISDDAVVPIIIAAGGAFIVQDYINYASMYKAVSYRFATTVAYFETNIALFVENKFTTKLNNRRLFQYKLIDQYIDPKDLFRNPLKLNEHIHPQDRLPTYSQDDLKKIYEKYPKFKSYQDIHYNSYRLTVNELHSKVYGYANTKFYHSDVKYLMKRYKNSISALGPINKGITTLVSDAKLLQKNKYYIVYCNGRLSDLLLSNKKIKLPSLPKIPSAPSLPKLKLKQTISNTKPEIINKVHTLRKSAPIYMNTGNMVLVGMAFFQTVGSGARGQAQNSLTRMRVNIKNRDYIFVPANISGYIGYSTLELLGDFTSQILSPIDKLQKNSLVAFRNFMAKKPTNIWDSNAPSEYKEYALFTIR